MVTKTNSNGTDYYGVIRSSADVKYSMLIEQGFHTNARELACIKLDEWHKKIAEKQAQVFADFFKLKKKSEEPEKLYSILLTKSDAEKLASELKAKGYNAIIREE